MNKSNLNVFWFRRDLRLEDNVALYHALRDSLPVLPLFIFDKNILEDLEDKYDARINFIYSHLVNLNDQLKRFGSGIKVMYGKPLELFKVLAEEYEIERVYSNEDYEPYAISRDRVVSQFLQNRGIEFIQFKDQVIFHKEEILNNNSEPFKVFSAYKRKWLEKFNLIDPESFNSEYFLSHVFQHDVTKLPGLADMGFRDKQLTLPEKAIDIPTVKRYDQTRDFPYMDGTTRLGIHFRFGTISIRKAVKIAFEANKTWLNELIWREFYSMILYHFPEVITKSFKPKYDKIEWINREDDFNKWCEGKTGYPFVDAGMRQLNETGYMHNRLRMVTASFLTKHLLIDWRWGEAYFAKKLLDYELASNNGGWQWAAGTGTDAQPYFRIFNPSVQARKFDPNQSYIKKWVPEYLDKNYPNPIIDHKFARLRAIETFRSALK
jgi:deoxyribodipyrimidine photo-lyase